MKKLLLLLSFLWLGQSALLAQLPDGSTAPNFTVVDIYGQSHNLYNLLNQGKTVYLDFFATWCVPCWNYHQTHALKNIWDQYGPPPAGSGEAYVISIESDAGTTVPCITNSAGCVGGTVGNWADGTPYPIADAASVANSYAITYYPTIMMVCPMNKKVYEVGQQSASGLWAARAQTCPPLAVTTVINNVKNVTCFNSNTGSIDISASGGPAPYVYAWSNGATTQDLINIPAGTYACTVTNSLGWTGTTGPIEVEGPPEPLSIVVTETIPTGCNGIKGTFTVQGNGGWTSNYNYVWSNGQAGPTAAGLNPGNYTVTVTDANNCTKTQTLTMAPPSPPVISVATPGTITCTNPTVQLNATITGGSGNFNYQWTASSGGYIVSGNTTPTPVVNAAGNYALQVSDLSTTCSGFASKSVTANITQPTADAGPPMTVTCTNPTAILAGSGSTGANFTYLWTPSGGGNVAGGGNTLTPTVSAAGTYTLKVTNTTNGCTQISSTTVSGNNTPPTALASGGAITCVASNVGLTATTNAGAPGFSWTGPNNYTSTLQNPTVADTGYYFITILDSLTGCTNVDTAVVALNRTPPGATAAGGTLTCIADSVTLKGTSQATNVTYAWTGPNNYTSTQQNPVVDTVGDYSLIVTATNNGCTSTDSTAVQQNTIPPVASAATPGNLNCNTSQLTLNGSGSSQGSNFGYTWTTTNGNIVSGGNTPTPLVNAVGTYQIMVLDSLNGCTASASTVVIQSTVVTAEISSAANVSCNGGNNGTASVSPAGGNNIYTYTWSNGGTTQSVSGLAAGTYTVVVTDGENCTAAATAIITEPEVLAANISATHQSAAGLNNGTATASPTGGTSGYTYAWSNSETTQTISGLAPGTYTVVVTDANGCTDQRNVTVNAYNCAISGAISGNNISCAGAANGTAEVTLSFANNPVIYTWSNGGNTQTIANLAPGTYTVEAKDLTNCAVVLSISISEPVVLLANASATHETANNANDGTATASPTGGTVNYTYQWSNGETTQTITNLAPGSYTVVVTDANGCTSVQTVVSNAYNCFISAQPAVSNVVCNGQNNGVIALNISNANEPLSIVWSNNATGATITNLGPGEYIATVTDANDCQLITGGTITEPQPFVQSATAVNPVCADDQSGSIETVASGGVMPYQYAWNTGANTASLIGLNPGTYILTTTDANGCALTNEYILTAQDQVPPQISVQNTVLRLGASGSVGVNLTTLNAAVSDNCGSAVNTTFSPDAFDCSQLGQHEIQIVATDGSGNVQSMNVNVTVIDDLAPVLTCPANITRCWYENTVEYDSPVAVDNCLANGGEWKQLEGLPSGSQFPVGVTNQAYSFTDASGNVGACSFTVQVTEPVALVVDNVKNDVDNQGVGAIDITVSGGTLPYTYLWTRDGAVVGNMEDLSGLTQGEYVVKVTDANGCTLLNDAIVVSNSVSAKEPEWLSDVSIRPNPTTNFTQVLFSNIPPSTLEISLVDATGRTLLRQESQGESNVVVDCTNLPEGTYMVLFRTGLEVGVRKLTVGR